MNEKYLKLLKEIAHTVPIYAERVMDYDKQKNDDKGLATAQTMRDDFQKLYDRMNKKDFNPDSLSRADFAKFLVGAFIISENLTAQIKTIRQSINGYKIDIIPKLDRIVNETKTDEESLKLANEIFQIIDEDK